MIEPEYYSLAEAAIECGCTDVILIRLGSEGKLRFYIQPKNWGYRMNNDPRTVYIINDPILIDDPVHLKKIVNGTESTMYFSEQYPDSYLEDLDEIEAAKFGDDLELSNQQIATLKAGKKVSVVRDEILSQLGVPICKDRLLLKSEDLAQLLQKNATHEKQVRLNEELKPWFIRDPKDPSPVQLWYIPARYFARQLVIADPRLLTKRSLLANKVVQSLTNAGIKKRGGKLPFNTATVLKALSNVVLS
ncbi:MAG: hypothetical protein WC856_22615 [Methylococcaceae bacterium]|jgi:hypothetical protein